VELPALSRFCESRRVLSAFARESAPRSQVAHAFSLAVGTTARFSVRVLRWFAGSGFSLLSLQEVTRSGELLTALHFRWLIFLRVSTRAFSSSRDSRSALFMPRVFVRALEVFWLLRGHHSSHLIKADRFLCCLLWPFGS
jgi:hypothetical protein